MSSLNTLELGVPKGHFLSDGASHRVSGNVGVRNLQSEQQRGGGVGHPGRREAPLWQRRAPHTAVVEGGEEVAVREAVGRVGDASSLSKWEPQTRVGM